MQSDEQQARVQINGKWFPAKDVTLAGHVGLDNLTLNPVAPRKRVLDYLEAQHRQCTRESEKYIAESKRMIDLANEWTQQAEDYSNTIRIVKGLPDTVI